MPLTFCSWSSDGFVVLSATAAFSSSSCCAWLPRAAASASLAASFACALRSAAGWFISAFWTWSWLLLLHATSVRAAAPVRTKTRIFISLGPLELESEQCAISAQRPSFPEHFLENWRRKPYLGLAGQPATSVDC